MRIGLISDTHNDKERLQRALVRLRSEDITTVLHAGDVTSTETLRLLRGFDAWIAQGNMDREPLLSAVAHELFGPTRFARLHDLIIGQSRIAMIHDSLSDKGRALLASQTYAYLVHGHTHRTRDEKVGPTRVINPGALGQLRWYQPSFAILNLSTGDLRWVKP